MNQRTNQEEAMRKINRALGLFLLCFGVIILAAVLFTETRAGKVANATAGLLIVAIGLGMIYRCRAKT